MVNSASFKVGAVCLSAGLLLPAVVGLVPTAPSTRWGLSHCPRSRLGASVVEPQTPSSSSSSSPNDEASSAAFTRQMLAEKQARYEETRRSQARADAGSDAIPALEGLPMTSFIDAEGRVAPTNAPPKTKASIFAVYDEAEALQFVGKSRNADQSLKTILVRQPEKSYYFRVYHIDKPSRTFLDAVADAWIAGAPTPPPGNDGGDAQKTWEAPLDVKPLMTADDRADLENKKLRGKEELALKAVARRFEADKKRVLEARGLKESIAFDAKLKGQGLLDLKLAKVVDDAPPTKAPPKKPSKAAAAKQA